MCSALARSTICPSPHPFRHLKRRFVCFCHRRPLHHDGRLLGDPFRCDRLLAAQLLDLRLPPVRVYFLFLQDQHRGSQLLQMGRQLYPQLHQWAAHCGIRPCSRLRLLDPPTRDCCTQTVLLPERYVGTELTFSRGTFTTFLPHSCWMFDFGLLTA